MAQITLGGNNFTIAPLGARKTFALQAKIFPAASEVISVLGDIAEGGGKLLDSSMEAIAPVVGRFFSRLPAEELDKLLPQILAGATMDGQVLFTGSAGGEPFDVLMQGRTLDTWRLVWFAIEVNYPDFFRVIAAVQGGKMGAQAAASPA